MKENLDRELWSSSTRFCGVDEVGRGALAGPVVAAAVVLPVGADLPGVCDSKLLPPRRRSALAEEIRRVAAAWAIGSASHVAVDRNNVLNATHTAMRRAIGRLRTRLDCVLVDGYPLPGLGLPCRGIIGGDNRSLSIASASILAKVYRDRLMVRFDGRHPGYGFGRNKGYGTPDHLAALLQLGPSPIHRRTFAPVASALRA